MPGSGGPSRTQDDLELDVVAEAYARRISARAGAAELDHLRDDLICRCLPLADRLAQQPEDPGEPRSGSPGEPRSGSPGEPRSGSPAEPRSGSPGEPLDDLRQVARLGVVRAVDRYTADRGSFVAFTLATITADLRRHLRISAGQAQETLFGDLRGGPDTAIEDLPDKVAVAGLLHVLPERIQVIVRGQFFDNRTQAELAEELGISQMHVSRLLHQALDWLRAALLSEQVPRWIGRPDGVDPDGLQVRVRDTEDGLRAEISGEVGLDSRDRLWRRLNAAILVCAPGRLTIDLAEVTLIDVAGARVLRDACRAAVVSQVDVTLTGERPHVAAVLDQLTLPPSVHRT